MEFDGQRHWSTGCDSKTLAYKDRSNARRACRAVSKKHGGTFRPYRCRFCGKWHITKIG